MKNSTMCAPFTLPACSLLIPPLFLFFPLLFFFPLFCRRREIRRDWCADRKQVSVTARIVPTLFFPSPFSFLFPPLSAQVLPEEPIYERLQAEGHFTTNGFFGPLFPPPLLPLSPPSPSQSKPEKVVLTTDVPNTAAILFFLFSPLFSLFPFFFSFFEARQEL